MSLQQWMDDFCGMHERARRGQLQALEVPRYLAARNELARALLKAQQISLRPGETPRLSLRAAVALTATLAMSAGKVGVLTRDIGSGGFSAIVPSPPPVGTSLPFTLRLGPEDLVEGTVRLVSLTAGTESRRAGFCFTDLAAQALERVELRVFDAVVEQLRS